MAGKSQIVYYSWVGNTQVVAKEIQRQTSFPIMRVEEKKERNPNNIMGAALGAVLGFKSRLKPMDYSLKDIENVFLGVQVWAGKSTPAINQYLSKASLKNKKVWLFVTKADEKIPQKFIDSVTNRIEKKGGKVKDILYFTRPWDPKKNEVMAQEEVKDSIHQWLNKIGNQL